VQKLAREFKADPSKILREARHSGPVTFEHLDRARVQTRHQEERGWLRPPKRWKVAEFKVGSNFVRAVVLTKAEERRRAAEASGRVPGPTHVPFYDLPLWAKGMISYYSPLGAFGGFDVLNHANEEKQTSRPVRFARGWRPRRPG
jgi:hypothetical protein